MAETEGFNKMINLCFTLFLYPLYKGLLCYTVIIDYELFCKDSGFFRDSNMESRLAFISDLSSS